jgi:hypothetical protein
MCRYINSVIRTGNKVIICPKDRIFSCTSFSFSRISMRSLSARSTARPPMVVKRRPSTISNHFVIKIPRSLINFANLGPSQSAIEIPVEVMVLPTCFSPWAQFPYGWVNCMVNYWVRHPACKEIIICTQFFERYLSKLFNTDFLCIQRWQPSFF